MSHPASPHTLLPLYNKPAEEVLQFGLLLLLLLLLPLFSLLVMMLLLLLLLMLFWMPKTVQSLLFLHPPCTIGTMIFMMTCMIRDPYKLQCCHVDFTGFEIVLVFKVIVPLRGMVS